jgi:hypothetical protein
VSSFKVDARESGCVHHFMRVFQYKSLLCGTGYVPFSAAQEGAVAAEAPRYTDLSLARRTWPIATAKFSVLAKHIPDEAMKCEEVLPKKCGGIGGGIGAVGATLFLCCAAYSMPPPAKGALRPLGRSPAPAGSAGGSSTPTAFSFARHTSVLASTNSALFLVSRRALRGFQPSQGRPHTSF